MVNVLVTMPFEEVQLERLRKVSHALRVTRADPRTADYAETDVLYAMAVPRDPARAPRLRWV